MDKFIKLLVIFVGISFVSCEKDNSQSGELEDPVVLTEPFIAGNKDCENYTELMPPILIGNDCITQYDDYYCLKPFGLTLNGTKDFGLSFSGNPSNYWMEQNFYNFSDLQLACNENNHLQKLNQGDTIHYGLNWKSGDKFLMTYSDSGGLIGDNWFKLDEDGFVGFLKLKGNDTILGWFRVSITTFQEGNAIHTAYEISDFSLSNDLME